MRGIVVNAPNPLPGAMGAAPAPLPDAMGSASMPLPDTGLEVWTMVTFFVF
jgi:hypothetical protein